MRKLLALLSVGVFASQVAYTQPEQRGWCGSDHFHQEMIKLDPAIANYEAQLNAFIKQYLEHKNSADQPEYGDPDNLDDTLHIPVVVHVIHEYGSFETLDDSRIHDMINNMNLVYTARNANITNVITPFVPYIGRAKIKFHLAKRDPYGNPTKGINRVYASTSGYSNQAKIGQWAPYRYLNIWVVKEVWQRDKSGGTTLAYAQFPSSGASMPYSDGILVGYNYINQDNTVEHEAGHYLNLYHTWNSSDTTAGAACGDDEVDDTPPTKGHFSTCQLYDTACLFEDKVIGKVSLDSATAVVDTATTSRPLVFNTRSGITVKAVNMYFADPAQRGDTVVIELRKGNTVLKTITDTVKIVSTLSNRRLQKINIDHFLPNWDSSEAGAYSLVLTRNPGAFIDSNNQLAILAVDGAAYVRSASSIDDRYNFFYNIEIRHGYFKIVKTLDGYDVIDYPDTANTQNIMDYSSCTNMFTQGQVLRMRAALKSSIGQRNNLIDSVNHVITGIFEPDQDLPPVAKFSVVKASNNAFKNIVCVGSTVSLANRSYGDTNITVNWSTGSNATLSSTTGQNVTLTGTAPGWADITLVASSNAGSDTLTSSNSVYFMSKDAINPVGYYQEFEANTMSNWPIFNYYNNSFYWAPVNVGYWDGTSLMFNGYDKRTYPEAFVNGPFGDVDEFFSPLFNIRDNMSGDIYLNFNYAGAYRTNSSVQMKDKLTIMYSTNCGATWVNLDSMVGPQISTAGTVSTEFYPAHVGQWKGRHIQLPAGVRTASEVMFRFRFESKPYESDPYLVAPTRTSNNFFIDRINISNFKVGVEGVVKGDKAVSIVPNPTTGAAYLHLNESLLGNEGQIKVYDITGKLVFTTEFNVNNINREIEIPVEALSAKGVYMVNVTSGSQKVVEKLIVQ